MSLEFMDGFDHYGNNQTGRKWDNTANTAGFVTGRFGGAAFSTGAAGAGSLSLTQGQLGSVATRTMGFALYPTVSSYVGALWTFLDGGTEQCSLRFSNSQFTVNRGSTVLATTTNTFIVNSWIYVEIQVTIGTTTGAFTLKVWGGTSPGVWASATGVNTQSTGNATTNGISLYYPNFSGAGFNMDDIYVLNSSGSVNNTFLGECRVLTALPTGDSAVNTLWVPSPTGAHYPNVADNPADDDSTYNRSQVVGQVDTYRFPAFAPTGAIAGVQSNLEARKDDISPRSFCGECRGTDGNNYDGAVTFPLTTAYEIYRSIREVDPVTSAPWTLAGLNASEFGVKLTA